MNEGKCPSETQAPGIVLRAGRMAGLRNPIYDFGAVAVYSNHRSDAPPPAKLRQV